MLVYTVCQLKYPVRGLTESTFSMRHDNDNCDLTIQTVATHCFVDVAHKSWKCYFNISQTRSSGDLSFSPIAVR